MAISIQQFGAADTSFLEQAMISFLQDPSGIAEFTRSVEKYFLDIACNYIRDTLLCCEESLLESPYRRAHWSVVKTDPREIITSVGAVRFERRLYRNKETGKNCYLLDHLLGLDRNEKIMEDAKARILEEAVQTSYRKGGINASMTDRVSKNAVKSIIHGLNFPTESSRKDTGEKKRVQTLYIDADEDHISLQFQKKKGDLVTDEQGRKCNNAVTKLIYVYEGVETDSPAGKRKHLVNPYYFSSTAEGTANSDLWDEVYRYITRVYDIDGLKKIYLNSDGAKWIKAGKERIAGLTHVLDEFHMNKYLRKMTSHLCDSSDEFMEKLKKAIKEDDKKLFRKYKDKLLRYAEDARTEDRIRESAGYILENWDAAVTRYKSRDIVFGCSAEGHVSHVLSSRMSSRPMGWSRTGADKMAHLRAYYFNNGDMLELVRYSRKELPKVAGAEKDRIFSAEAMLRWENRARRQNGKYYEAIRASIGLQKAKQLYFSKGIWGLK